jgi:hypothetical protein
MSAISVPLLIIHCPVAAGKLIHRLLYNPVDGSPSGPAHKAQVAMQAREAFDS